jgi:hypothetical protein
MDTQVDPRMIEHYRHGRIGLCFLLMSLYVIVLGARIHLPKRVSKREREIELKRDKAAAKEAIWMPTLWKRSNMIFTTICFALFLTIIVEFSFWENYSTYIWYIIVALKFVAIGCDLVLGAQLKESLLMCPMASAMGIIQGLVTLGSADFADFLQAFAIEFALMIAERVYIGPLIGSIIDWIIESVEKLVEWVRKSLRMRRTLTLEEEVMQEEAKAEGKEKAREVDIAVEGGETVEPILDAFAGYACDTVALFYTPFLIGMLMVFRDELAIPDLYSIREQDMEYYLLFALIIIAFQLVDDMFLHNVLELWHGWKIYDYLVYTRYRFLQRETRWKGLEDSLDECIEEGMRTLDQMCFSSQFYMMLTMHVTGIMFFILGLEIILRAGYNLFGDPAMLILMPMVVIACSLLRRILMWVANLFGIWRIKHANTAWHSAIGDDEDDDFGIPKWDELEAMNVASHEQYLMNQKLTSETFRHRFLDYNRPWLVAQLPNILTPRTLRRSRPYLLAQITKLLGSVNADISSDSSGDEAALEFGPVALTPVSRTMIRLWLARARRRLRLTEVVQPIIARARRPECEICLSRRQLQVELLHPVEELADRFEAENPDMEEFDQVSWKQFFMKHQKFRTICLNCVQARQTVQMAKATGAHIGSDDADRAMFGPVHLSASSKAIMQMWVDRARRRRGYRGGGARRPRLQVSSDDEDDDQVAGQPWARRPLELSAATRALAKRWLSQARQGLLDGPRSRKGTDAGDGVTAQDIQAARVKAQKAPLGSKSRFRRK